MTKRNSALMFFIFLFSLTLCYAQANKSSTAKIEEKNKPIKCQENDTDCFIRAAETCQKASYVHNDSADLGEYVLTKNDYFEIRGGTKNECKFYLKVLHWGAAPNEKYLEELKKRGEKPREIDPEIKARHDQRMKDMIGKEGVCTFTAEKLAALFKRWKDKSFSSEDYRGAKCKGTYFVPENGFSEDF